jgi:hypothetical protein
MKLIAARLWSEEDGFLLSAEAVLYATICVIGLIAGLTSIRESVVTEMADVAQAIANLNQTFSARRRLPTSTTSAIRQPVPSLSSRSAWRFARSSPAEILSVKTATNFG